MWGGRQQEGEPVVDYLHQVDAVFKSTICEPLWGLPNKQVLFVRKYMNEVWRRHVRILMQDMHLRFHYDDFIGVMRQQAELWEPFQTLPYDLAEDKNMIFKNIGKGPYPEYN